MLLDPPFGPPFRIGCRGPFVDVNRRVGPGLPRARRRLEPEERCLERRVVQSPLRDSPFLSPHGTQAFLPTERLQPHPALHVTEGYAVDWTVEQL